MGTRTEGIKYAGSKRLILPKIITAVSSLGAKTVLDGFSGTTRVGQHLKASGYTVISNDIADWSRVFGQCYLLNTKPAAHYQPMIDHLNSLKGVHSWFTEHYGGKDYGGSAVQPDGTKRIWQIHNTMKLDAIREEIDKLTTDETERAVLLTSLILALDKVDSSVGHQVSYLKMWSNRSYNTMKLKVPRLLIDDKPHEVHQGDIFDAAAKIGEVDVAYFDPPYGSSNDMMPSSRVRYASYYHIWKTVVLNDRPKLVGVANRREDAGDKVSGSVFEEFRKNEQGNFIALEAIKDLIGQTNAKTVILSYSNNGRATAVGLKNILDELNLRFRLIEFDHKTHVMSSMKWTNDWINQSVQKGTKEYLFVIEKKPSELFETVEQSRLSETLHVALPPAQLGLQRPAYSSSPENS